MPDPTPDGQASRIDPPREDLSAQRRAADCAPGVAQRQQPATHLPWASNSIVRPLMARWAGALSCLISLAVWEVGRSFPPSVAGSFTWVRITDTGRTSSFIACAPEMKMPGLGPRLSTARLALWNSLITVFISAWMAVSPDR